ncbi:MAG: DUF6627 family protein [Gammaproteobacteria bacterium]
MKTLQRILCLFMSLSLVGLPVGPAQAAMIGNAEIITEVHSELNRSDILHMLDREAARQQLSALGVSPEMVKQRVAQMTDAEVAQLNQHLADLPAGGDIWGVLLLLFIVFIITDMLGATDIFPFVKPINK